MTNDRYNDTIDGFLGDSHKMASEKRIEYTISQGEKDVHANFKNVGKRLEIDPKQIIMVYLLKHMDSITNYVNTGTEYSDEKIEERISDAIQYLLLLVTLIVDERGYSVSRHKTKGLQNDPEC